MRAAVFFFLGIVFAAGVAILGYGAWALIGALGAGHGEDGAIARQANGAMVVGALVVGAPLVTIAGAIAYAMRRSPGGQGGRPRPRQ